MASLFWSISLLHGANLARRCTPFEQVKSVLGDRIRIIKVDVDKYGVTASQYRIQSVPTLMLFRNGEVLWRTSGVVDKAELTATLDPFLT